VASYYYLMAQLPYLIYEQKPPMSSAAFRELAVSLMDEEDAKFFDCLSLDLHDSLDNSTGCPFADAWHEWERALRLNIAKHRANRIKRKDESSGQAVQQEPPFVPSDAALTALKAITTGGSPLEAEIFIDRARWNAIDNISMIEGINYFDRNSAYAYFLKLLLLERRQSFDVEKGFAEYKSLYAAIINNANSVGGITDAQNSLRSA